MPSSGMPASAAASTDASASGFPSNAAALGNVSPADLTRIVLDYLGKKGYTRTEAMLRVESANAIHESDIDNLAGEIDAAYRHAYIMVRDWIERSLDLYKGELRKVLYPIFVHSYLDLVSQGSDMAAKAFMAEFSVDFYSGRPEDIETLRSIALPDHAIENSLAQLFRNNRYKINLTRTVFDLLLHHLHEMEALGGAIPIRFLNEYIDVQISTEPATGREVDKYPEGIVGHTSLQSKQLDQEVLQLGERPMDKSMQKEIVARIAAGEQSETTNEEEGMEDAPTIAEVFQNMKREGTEDSPAQETVPLPPLYANTWLSINALVKRSTSCQRWRSYGI